MTARVPLVEPADAPILARPYYPSSGPASPILQALAQVPELVPVTMPFLAQVLGPSAIELRAKEIVILRVSARARCRYCVGAHTVAAADAGLRLDELRVLRGETAAVDTLTADDLALVALSDAVAGDDTPADAVVDAVRARFGNHGLVELTVLASATLMLNRLCTTLGLPLGEGAKARLAELGLAA